MNSEKILRDVIWQELERELAALPSDEELQEMIELPADFYSWLEYLFRSHARQAWIRHLGKRAACFLLVLIVATSVVVTLNEDVRAVCVRWFQSLADNGMTEYQVPASSSGEKNRGKRFTLDYVPDGYVQEPSGTDDTIQYIKGTQRIWFDYGYGEDTTLLIDNEHSRFSQITLKDGTSCDYYESNEKGFASRLIWMQDGYLCNLRGNDVDKETLIRMAGSIREVSQ